MATGRPYITHSMLYDPYAGAYDYATGEYSGVSFMWRHGNGHFGDVGDKYIRTKRIPDTKRGAPIPYIDQWARLPEYDPAKDRYAQFDREFRNGYRQHEYFPRPVIPYEVQATNGPKPTARRDAEWRRMAQRIRERAGIWDREDRSEYDNRP